LKTNLNNDYIIEMLLPNRKKKDDEIRKHLEIEDKLLSLFENEKIDIEELMNVVKSFQKLRNDTREILTPILSEEKKLEEDLLKSYEDVKSEIISVYKYLDMDSEKTATLNLHIVRDFLIEFSKLAKDDLKFPKVDINHIVLTSKEETIPLRFKNGKKIILTNRNFDLSEFNHEELLEILRFLDIVITDDRYDYLRSEISKEIATISSFSPLK